MLQEVQKEMYQSLVKDFSNAYHISPLVKINWGPMELDSSKKHVDNGMVTLIRRERVTSGDIQFTKLRLSGDHSRNHYANIAVVNLSREDRGGGGEKLIICNLHLESKNAPSRLTQIERLVKYFKQFGEKQTKIIIGGDFNSNDHEKCHQYLSKVNSCDNFNNLYLNNSRVTYFEDADFIDHLYVRGMTQFGKYILNKVDKKNSREAALELYGSDHFPIFASIFEGF
jgi:endonuclease/exonuclease/phosphatase family metal-dependent hydrolase